MGRNGIQTNRHNRGAIPIRVSAGSCGGIAAEKGILDELIEELRPVHKRDTELNVRGRENGFKRRVDATDAREYQQSENETKGDGSVIQRSIPLGR